MGGKCWKLNTCCRLSQNIIGVMHTKTNLDKGGVLFYFHYLYSFNSEISQYKQV